MPSRCNTTASITTPASPGSAVRSRSPLRPITPQRGADRSRENTAGNAPVYFNGSDNSFVEESLHQDNSPEITAVYDGALTTVKRDTGRLATHGLRELIVDGKADDNAMVEKSMEEMLTRSQVRKGLDVRVQQINGFRYGQDYEVGDRISYNSRYFQSALQHDTVQEVTFTYDAEGDEQIELALGDPQEDLLDKMKNGSKPHTSMNVPGGAGAADIILPVAASNVAGSSLAVPHGDHQHKSTLQADDSNETTPVAGVTGVLGGHQHRHRDRRQRPGDQRRGRGRGQLCRAGDHLWRGRRASAPPAT